MKSKLYVSIVSLILVLMLAITGCAKTQTTTEPVEEVVETVLPEDSPSQYPLTIKHAYGETIIEKKPERVATIAWGNHDLPLALGIIPVGISKANYGVVDGSGLLPWTLAKFKELGVDNPILFDDVAGLNYEAISDAQPDIILAAYSGITKEEYELLSEIADVVAFPTLPWQTFWRDQISINAAGLGMAVEGNELISNLESLISEKIQSYPQISGKSAAFFYFNPTDLGKFYVYLPSDPRVAYLADLGMVFPESVLKLAEDSESFALELSAENVDLLHDIDVIITYGNADLLEALQNDPLVSTIPAVKRGSVALIEDGTPLAASGTPSALSIPATIDEYLKIIAEAAGK